MSMVYDDNVVEIVNEIVCNHHRVHITQETIDMDNWSCYVNDPKHAKTYNF